MQQRRSLRLTLLVMAIVTIAAPSAAHAQQGAGAFRLSLDGNLFRFDKDTVTLMGSSSSTKTKRYGILDAGLGIGAFYSVTDESLIGGHVQFAGANTDSGGMTSSAKAYSIVPTFEYALMPGETVRPFFAAGLGVGGAKQDGGADLVHMTLLLQAGAHLFATDSFSFDGSIGFSYLNGKLKPGGGADDRDYSGFRFMMTLGISGWLGGEVSPQQPAGGSGDGGSWGSGGGWQGAGGAGTGGAGAPGAGGTPSGGGVQQQGEWLTASTPVSGGTLEVFARPAAGTDEVGLRLTFEGPSARFGQCRSLWLYRGSGRLELPLHREANQSQAGVRETLVAQTTIDIVETWANDPQAGLGPCEQRWVLSPQARSTVQSFVTRLRNSQGAQGGAGSGWGSPPPKQQPPQQTPPPLPDPEGGAY